MESSSLPFTIEGLYAGCAKLKGLLFVDPEEVKLEYQLKLTMFGVFSGPINSHAIAMATLERAECGLGFFAPWLVLTARTLNAFGALPGSDAAQLKLRIPWKYRRQLRVLTSDINLQLSFRDADRYRERLPGHV
jgi:hypothetical protein